MAPHLDDQVAELLNSCRQHGIYLRTAESCTAGGVAAALAAVPGASDVLDRGWVVYSNRAKCEELAVDAGLIEQYGAVSREVVEAMAKGGAAENSACIAVSGIAGPGGGTKAKPVGTVWMALAWPGRSVWSRKFLFAGERSDIQSASVKQAIIMLLGEAKV